MLEMTHNLTIMNIMAENMRYSQTCNDRLSSTQDVVYIDVLQIKIPVILTF